MTLVMVLWIILCLVFLLSLAAIGVIIFLFYHYRIDSRPLEPAQPAHENDK